MEGIPISEIIRFILSNMPAIMFAVALVVAALRRDGRAPALRFLDWMLLFAVGASALWAGLIHFIMPHLASTAAGWANSPFQFEIGVSGIAIGLVAIAAFWRNLSFKSAVVAYIVLFYIGAAIGQIRQAVETGGLGVAANNLAAGHFGLLLAVTLAKIVLLPLLLWAAWRYEDRA